MIMRAKIQYLVSKGLKDKEVSAHLGVNIKTVQKWKKRTDIVDLKRSGRPSVHRSPETVALITDLCRDTWYGSIRRASQIISRSAEYVQRNETISASTVTRIVRSTEWGRIAYRATVAPMLTEKNIRDRLAFASYLQRAGYCQPIEASRPLLDNILFTDESFVELYPRPNRQNTRIRTSDPRLRTPVPIPKHGLKIMIAGGLGANGLSKLFICEPGATITGAYYREKG